MVNEVKREIGDYHVVIKGSYITSNYILKNRYTDGRNFIKYKEIGRVYKNTNLVCTKNKCDAITYNDSLLSLYGLSKNKNVLSTFRFFLYFFIGFFGSIIMLILYNIFSISTDIKRKNIILYKFAGSNNSYLLNLHFKQVLLISFLSILFGFIISVFLNVILIKIINSLLYEIFKGRLFLSIYHSFVVIPIIFMFLIIIICSLFPFKKIRKYRVMELFRNNEIIKKCDIRLKSNIIYYYFKINIFRFKDKYKNLIICVFIFCFSFNVVFLILSYTLRCIDDYIIVPNYDLSISISGEYNFSKIIDDFNALKKNEFRSCEVNIDIPREYYKRYDESNVIFTDLGGNEVLNNVEVVGKKNNKISHLKYNRFKKLDKIVVDTFVIDGLNLTNKIFFGLDGKNTIINLDKNIFNKICPQFNSNLIMKTDYQGIDDYLNKLVRKEKISMSYLNVKKTKQIISNLILVLKILFHFSIFLILVTLFILNINFSIFSIYKRRKELATLRSLGFTFKEVVFSLLLESFYVSFKGFVLSIPFVFGINKYFYIGIKKVFDFGKIIINGKELFTSFLLSLFAIFISLFLSYLLIFKKSLICNIKNG